MGSHLRKGQEGQWGSCPRMLGRRSVSDPQGQSRASCPGGWNGPCSRVEAEPVSGCGGRWGCGALLMALSDPQAVMPQAGTDATDSSVCL